MSDPGKTKPVFGGRIFLKREVDVLGVAAILISFVTLGLQLRGCVQGPVVDLLTPDKVIVYRSDPYADFKTRVHFGVTMAFTNRGQQGYNGVVQRESISFTIGIKPFTYYAEDYGKFEGGAPDPIKFTSASTAEPFVVNGGDVQTRNVHFIPWPFDCSTAAPSCNPLANHVYWAEFVENLQNWAASGKTRYGFVFQAETLDRIISARCAIAISPDIVKAMATSGNYPFTCYKF